MAKKLFTYITTFYPTEQQPWHGIFFRDHAEALAEFEDVSVMHLQVPSFRQKKTLGSSASAGVQNGVYTVQHEHPVLTHRFRGAIQRAYLKSARSALKTIMAYHGRKPDYLIAQCVLPAGGIAQQLSDEEHIPFGVIDHYSFLESMFNEQGDKLKYIYERSDFLAAVSDDLSQKVQQFLGNKRDVVTLGNVLGRQFQEYPPSNSMSDKPDLFTWLFVGPDVPKKGTDVLQKALLTLEAAKKRNWKLTIVGQGDFKQLKKEPYGSKITHISQLSRTEMVDCMQNHHALVSTSPRETFGMAILEMLSQGKPVVATRSGGPEEFVSPDCGYLVEKNSPGQIANAMTQLMDNYNHFEGAKIRKTAITNFGSRSFYNKFKKLVPII